MENSTEQPETAEHRQGNKELYLPASIIIAALIIGGAIVYGGGPQLSSGAASVGDTTTTQQQGTTVDIELASDEHMRGNPQAPVTIVEFSDLECPFCQRFHPTMLQAMEEFEGQIRWVYRHFPLDQIHPQARPAAEASECVWEQAGDEGFWLFSDAVFANQEQIGASLYQQLAQNMGLDMQQFNTCVETRKYQDKVQEHYDSGLQAGVTGTPGSFVNGQPVRGAISYSQLKSIIESKLGN